MKRPNDAENNNNDTGVADRAAIQENDFEHEYAELKHSTSNKMYVDVANHLADTFSVTSSPPLSIVLSVEEYFSAGSSPPVSIYADATDYEVNEIASMPNPNASGKTKANKDTTSSTSYFAITSVREVYC